MSHTLYNTMLPLGQMHAKEVARAVDALCLQACTHSAMAGALVARGMTPSDAFHTVLAWEGAGQTIPTRMMMPSPGLQSFPIMGVHGAQMPGARQMMAPGVTGIMGVPRADMF
ncbi:MAG: hypothetical protein ACOY94_14060 [Bacillota bacterium]